MISYVNIWNWIAIVLAVVSIAAGSGRANALAFLFSVAPFGLALSARHLVDSSLFCLLARLANGLCALLMAAKLLQYADHGILTANMAFMACLFVAVPLLNAIYLIPRDRETVGTG